MRIRHLLVGAAVLAFATPALAQTTPVSFSPEFQTALEEDYGVREGEVLRAAVSETIARELSRRGIATGSAIVEVTIVSARPNRPTMQQMLDEPSLDFSSISIGGAELRAVVRHADGGTTEVEHRRYNHSLSDLSGAATAWTEARRAIRQFAVKVADAYIATPR
jgi:hypothetical protein